MTDLTEARKWLALCGSCDAGLPMSCTCPEGDIRTVLAEALDEVETLRADDRVVDLIAAAKAWRRQFGDPGAHTDKHDMDLIRAVDRLAYSTEDAVGELLGYRTADGKLWHPHDVAVVREEAGDAGRGA